MRISREKLQYYAHVHHWLKKNFGKAVLCEFSSCEKKSTNFSWALLREKDYEKKRENFIQLCRVCHAKYDCTDETREKMRLSRIGKTIPESTKEKMRLVKIGKKHTPESITKMRECKGKPCIQLDNNKNPIQEFRSRKEAIRKLKLKITRHTIGWAIKTGWRGGGFYWINK